MMMYKSSAYTSNVMYFIKLNLILMIIFFIKRLFDRNQCFELFFHKELLTSKEFNII